MMFKTHLAFGFLLGLFALERFQPANQVLFIMIVLIASGLPDMDHPDSKFGKNFKIIGFLFEHRGFFHSLFALFVVYFLSLVLFRENIYIYAALIGYGSHMVADCFTKEGIKPFHPLTRLAIRGFMRTGHVAEFVFFIIVVVFSFVKLIQL